MPVKIKSNGRDIDIDLSMAYSAGGKTGSVCIRDNTGDYYQYKQPIVKKSFKRQFKANFVDSENFGELLASRIARVLDDDVTNPRIPAVYFVMNTENPYIAIASKYLKGGKGAVVQSLNDYLSKPPEQSSIKLVTTKGLPGQGIYDINEYPHLKEEIAAAIACSALIGDHDIHPDNMVVIKEENGDFRLGRIDFGHAFNNLMRFSTFGGQRMHPNNIIDFFNRETVDGLSSKSKLWRYYPGLVPSRAMVNALRNLINKEDVSLKIGNAINEVKDEIKEIIERSPVSEEQIISSFSRIAEHVSGKKVSSKLTLPKKIDAIFIQLHHFIEQNKQQMAFAADIMDLQVNIKEAIEAEHWSALTSLKQDYLTLMERSKDWGPFSWFKEIEPLSPFKGDFDAYVVHLKNEKKLKQVAQEIDNFLGSSSPESEKKRIQVLQRIIVNPKKSVEDKISLVHYELDKIINKPQPFSHCFTAIINFIIRLLYPSREVNAATTNPASGFFAKKVQDIIEDKPEEILVNKSSGKVP